MLARMQHLEIHAAHAVLLVVGISDLPREGGTRCILVQLGIIIDILKNVIVKESELREWLLEILLPHFITTPELAKFFITSLIDASTKQWFPSLME